MENLLIFAGVALLAAAVTGAILGGAIAIIAQKFAVEKDPRIDEVIDLLPGANCGGCGFAGCGDMAKALILGKINDPAKCPAASNDAVEKISEVLGLISEPGIKKVAVVACGGNHDMAKESVRYNGVADCKSALIVQGGTKGCRYGCLGYGTCAHACPFNAIEIKNGLAIVHPDLCVGCGKCVETCPRKLIALRHADAEVHIYCSSPAKGADKRKVCKVACIGCRKCVKAAEEGQIEIKGTLAVVNYANAPKAEIVEKSACPMHCIGLAQDYKAIGVIPEKNEANNEVSA